MQSILLINNNTDDDDDEDMSHKLIPLCPLSSRHGWPTCQRWLPVETHIKTCAAGFYINRSIARSNIADVTQVNTLENLQANVESTCFTSAFIILGPHTQPNRDNIALSIACGTRYNLSRPQPTRDPLQALLPGDLTYTETFLEVYLMAKRSW